MQWILTCENGKEIDMSYYIGQQMEKKITRQEVLDRIEFYKSTNTIEIRTKQDNNIK